MKLLKKQQKDTGRSMVEMLGVLAIIGVLSIGGIAGYTMAMNRYKANQILDLAGKLSVIAQVARSSEAGDDWNWNTILPDYKELGMIYGGSYPIYYSNGHIEHKSKGHAYETTFMIDLNGNVWVSPSAEGVRNAIESMTGAEWRGSYQVITAND